LKACGEVLADILYPNGDATDMKIIIYFTKLRLLDG